jgi:hypothetical protein
MKKQVWARPDIIQQEKKTEIVFKKWHYLKIGINSLTKIFCGALVSLFSFHQVNNLLNLNETYRLRAAAISKS